MKKYHNCLKGIIVLSLCAALCGCGLKETADSSLNGTTTENALSDIPDSYSKEGENITFDTKVTVAQSVKTSGMKDLSAGIQAPDPEKARDILMGTAEIVGKNEEKGNYWYEGADNEVLSINDTSISYSTPFFVNISSCFRLEKNYSDYNADKYEVNKDLAFSSVKDAFSDIKEQLAEMGISVDDQYKCFSLDHTLLAQEESVVDIDGNQDLENYKDSWSSDDDCYNFVWNQHYDGSPIYHIFYDAFPLVEDANAAVQAVYNKDGIQWLQVEKVFQFTENEETYSLKPFEDIATVIENKYTMILGTAKYTVQSAELYYMAQKISESEYDVLPVWIFKLLDAESGKVVQDVINAQTGEEIIWEEK